ncbi:MAG: hypothetical protein HZY79_15755 [Rhodoblastus sp.]|nr:MAG: hypothetical protein HZY79_15755 [Rhodoblastus sp.]
MAGVAMGESSAIARAQFALGGVAFVISLGFLGVLAALERARLDRKELDRRDRALAPRVSAAQSLMDHGRATARRKKRRAVARQAASASSPPLSSAMSSISAGNTP